MGNVTVHSSWSDTCINNPQSHCRATCIASVSLCASSRSSGGGGGLMESPSFSQCFLRAWHLEVYTLNSKLGNKVLLQRTQSIWVAVYQKLRSVGHLRLSETCPSHQFPLLFWKSEAAKNQVQRANGGNRTFIILWVCNIGFLWPYHVVTFLSFQDLFYHLPHCDNKERVNMCFKLGANLLWSCAPLSNLEAMGL